MKKLHTSILYAALVMIMVQLLSSCGSVGITKMRYNKGYNLEIFASKKKREKEEKATMAFRDSIMKKNAYRLAESKAPVTVVASEEPETVPTRSESVAVSEPKAVSQAASTDGEKTTRPAISKRAIKHELKEAGVSVAEMKHAAKEASANDKKGNTETDVIILVILSLFPILCLIAVYLHDGGITTNFWVDLILHLTLFGEIIYALLVVLDVIDLS